MDDKQKDTLTKIMNVLISAITHLVLGNDKEAVSDLDYLITNEALGDTKIIRTDDSITLCKKAGSSDIKGPCVEGYTVQADGPLNLIQASLLARQEGRIPQEQADSIVINCLMLLSVSLLSKKAAAAAAATASPCDQVCNQVKIVPFKL